MFDAQSDFTASTESRPRGGTKSSDTGGSADEANWTKKSGKKPPKSSDGKKSSSSAKKSAKSEKSSSKKRNNEPALIDFDELDAANRSPEKLTSAPAPAAPPKKTWDDDAWDLLNS